MKKNRVLLSLILLAAFITQVAAGPGTLLSSDMLSVQGEQPVQIQSVYEDVYQNRQTLNGTDGVRLSELRTYGISGYIAPDFVSGEKSGFKVSVADTGVSAITDNTGYFKIDFGPPLSGSFKVIITKANYLMREIDNIKVVPDLCIGTKDTPVDMWAGDLNGDNAINIADIMEVTKCFNCAPGDEKYNTNSDLNKDNAVNISDVMIVVKHFNTNGYGSFKVSSSRFIDIAESSKWTVGLKGDGTVWNLTSGKQIEGLSDVKAVYAGDYSDRVVALKEDGTAIQVNYNLTLGEYTNLRGIKDISYNGQHTLFLLEDGTLYASGVNDYGQLGIGEELGALYTEPVRIQGLPEGKVIDIATGEKHSVILMEDGTVWTCGDNYDGALGVSEGFKSENVTIIPAYIDVKPDYSKYVDKKYISFDITGYLTPGENVEIYGMDRNNDIFRYKTGFNTVAKLNLTDNMYTLSICYGEFNCAVLKGKLFEDELNIVINVAVSNDKYDKNIALDIITTNYSNKKINAEICDPSGRVKIIERNNTSQLKPVKVEGLTGVKAVYAGNSSSYAVKNDGTVWAWGKNTDGRLNIDTEDDVWVPTQMNDLSDIVDLAVGKSHNTALKSDGTVWSWGENISGSLGQGSYERYIQKKPVQTQALNGSVAVSECRALKSDGSAWGWGYNGEYGDSFVNSCYPVMVIQNKAAETRLKSLTVDGAGIAFNPDITNYTVTLRAGITAVPWVSAATYNPTAEYYISRPGGLPGSATITVTSEDGSSSRIYTINFDIAPDATSPKVLLSAQGSIDFGGDIDCYNFTAKTTKTYTILTEGGTDTVIYLYDSKKSLIASNDDGEGRESHLETELVGGNDYQVVVSHFDSKKGTGKYVLKVIDSVKLLPEGYAYLEDLVQEVHGVLSTEQPDKYRVSVDLQHSAVFDGSKYKIDSFSGRVIVKVEDFVNALGLQYTFSDTIEESGQTTRGWNERIYTMKFGTADKYPAAYSAKVVPVQKVLRLLGCGKKLKSVSGFGAVYQELKITGIYDWDTADALRDFQTDFMGMDPTKTSGDKIDTATAAELTKYNLIRTIADNQGGGISWLKESGARVKEYLTKCISQKFIANNFEFKVEKGAPKIYYREFKKAPGIQLKINGLIYYSREEKCYAKINSIEKAVSTYNQEKVAYAAKYIGSVTVYPRTMSQAGEIESDPVEFKSLYNFIDSTGSNDPYVEISEAAENFGGFIGTPSMEEESICVASFINARSGKTVLKFNNADGTVREGGNTIVKGIEFKPYSSPTANNKLYVNIIQLAQYLGFYNIYSAPTDNDLKLCIDALRIPKESIGLGNIISIGVSSIPGVGDYKDMQEAVTGVDLITGEKLTLKEQVFTAVCVFLPVINGKAVRVKKVGYIKAGTKALAEGAVSIKKLLKSDTEKVFEEVKSVTVSGDKLILTTKEGKTVNLSKKQTKAELVQDGMTDEAAENVIKCAVNQCFSGDTLISTKDGLKRIDQVKEGEYVLAKDVNSGTIDYKQVKTVYIKSTYEFVHLKLGDEEIRTTASHLFFTDSGWWKAAENLKPGDRILNFNGELKTLIGKSIETLPEPEKIYNLNVDEFHTYFVGTNGLLVHNDCSEIMTQIVRDVSKYSDDVMHYVYKPGKYVPSNPSTIAEWERLEQAAISNYNLFRGRTDDIAKVASNTGWDINDIQKIKNHMFLDDIKFSDGRIEKFVPDYEMSVAWQRLIDGQYYDNDILLLKHELTELSHMKQLGSFQEAAHDFANGSFNWALYLKTLGGS